MKPLYVDDGSEPAGERRSHIFNVRVHPKFSHKVNIGQPIKRAEKTIKSQVVIE